MFSSTCTQLIGRELQKLEHAIQYIHTVYTCDSLGGEIQTVSDWMPTNEARNYLCEALLVVKPITV